MVSDRQHDIANRSGVWYQPACVCILAQPLTDWLALKVKLNLSLSAMQWE